MAAWHGNSMDGMVFHHQLIQNRCQGLISKIIGGHVIGEHGNAAIIHNRANNRITIISHDIAANANDAWLAIIIFEMPEIAAACGALRNQLMPC